LRALFAAGTATGLTDRELLERYTARRAESAEAAAAAEMAFAALVDRHGAMVWGVCRRLLADTHEAEDAFQATFLVLVRKAGSVRVDGSLGRWLYGVAHRVALRARSEAERQGPGIGRVSPTSSDDPAGDVELRELRNAVSEELDRLPAKYRCPVELCHLQGMTYDQAARQLNWPVATFKSRLTRGRRRLRERLARRGLAPAMVAVGVAGPLSGEGRAAVPLALARSTVRAATGCATGSFPTAVTDLTQGVLKMMMWEKLKLVAVGALVAVGLTARALSQPAPDGENRAPRPAEKLHEKQMGDPHWVRSLPCGASIEVMGVSSFPSRPDTWWRPDGTPLRPAPCDPNQPGISSSHGVPRLIVARLARIPDGADYQWSIAEAAGSSIQPATRGGKSLPGLSELMAMLPADAVTCTVRFQVAAGPWKTIEAWGKESGAIGSRSGPSYIFSGAIATKEGTVFSVTHDIQDKPVRIVAVSADGKEVPGEVRSVSGVRDFLQLVVQFNQPPEQIRKFRLQTRPYEGVEIPGIALKRD
jgi:RNA polymerase sigma factor (sigma-70 family)